MSRKRRVGMWTLGLGLGLVFLVGLSKASFAAWVDADGTGVGNININTNAGSSIYPSLYLDSNDYPHIAWHDDTDGNQDIFYLKWNGSSWVDADGTGVGNININTNLGSSIYPSLYLDSSGYPHIAWHDDTDGNQDIFYLKWSAAAAADDDDEWYDCAIATASYGTPMAEEIKALSDFRDEYLLTNKPGQILVSTYERISPPIADFIRDKEPLKAMVRTGLKPLVWVADKVTH